MKKAEFKTQLYSLLSNGVEEQTFDEVIQYARQLLVKYQQENEEKRNTENKRKPWTDEDLTIILSCAPTAENCMHFAKLFKRGYGSIEQIYHWASTDDKEISEKREKNIFVQQVKRIAKEVGWRA